MYLLCTDFRKAALGPTSDLHLPSTSIDDTSSVQFHYVERLAVGPHAGMPVSVRLSLSRRAMASSSTFQGEVFGARFSGTAPPALP